MNISRNATVLFVGRNTIQCFIPSEKTIVTISWAEDMIGDLMVVNEAAFVAFVMSQLAPHKVEAQQAIIMLSEQISFRKVLLGKTSAEQDKEKEDFLEALPIERPLMKQYTFGKEHVVVAVPGDMVSAVQQVCTKMHMSVASIVPQYVYVNYRANVWLDASMAVSILKDASTSYSYPLRVIAQTTSEEATKNTKRVDSVLTLPKLLIVFGFLLIILLVLLIVRQ